MGIFDGSLIACDIDGTILKNGVMPQRNIDAMEYFKSEGGKVCLATGRTAPALAPVLELYNGYAPSVVCNGSMIYDTVSGEILYERILAESELSALDRALAADKNVGIELHSGKTIYKLTRTKETEIHQNYEKIDAVPIMLPEAKNLKINKILYLFDSIEQQNTVKEAVINGADNSYFCDTLVMIYGKMRRYLEHMPKGVSKSETLLKLLDIVGVKREKFYTIGDGFNDIEMLKTAAFSACPADAVEAAKKEADIIVGKAEDGAFADFIDILKRRQ